MDIGFVLYGLGFSFSIFLYLLYKTIDSYADFYKKSRRYEDIKNIVQSIKMIEGSESPVSKDLRASLESDLKKILQDEK